MNKVFDIDGRPVRVEQVPATVCTHCGEPVFSRDTAERVRRMMHGEAKPIKSIQMDVFDYRSSGNQVSADSIPEKVTCT